MPSDHIIVYRIHEDPSNPNSSVVFIVKLRVHAESMNGHTVEWSVSKIWCIQPGSPENRYWVKESPTLPGSGYWTITHSDPDNPQLSEFNMPPQMTGTAAAADSSYADLDYDVQGSDAFGTSPWTPAMGLTYQFQLVGAAEPEEDGDDKPVDPDDEEPPS